MSKNSGYVSALQAKLRQFDEDVSALGAEARAKSLGAYEERMQHLRASRDAAHKKLVRLHVAGESVGAQMHAGMQASWEAMRAALKKASADLGK